MKKFALLALVLSFAGLVLAGCPSNNAAKKSNAANTAPTNAENKS
jgi:outer membrane murein-binding lipoprotein Lpp